MEERRPAVRVLLADDHTMFRQGMREMLSTDGAIEIVGQAADGREAVALARRLRPDVVVLDVEMPFMGAEEAMRPLLRISPPPSIVVVTMHDDPKLVRRLLGLGASAYLVKSASMQELISAVRTAAEVPEEGRPRDENVIMVLSRSQLDGKAGEGTDGLSGRELEVLLLVARGLSNHQAARALHLSEGTVKRHLANIYRKIGVSSRGEATRKALWEGWISAIDMARAPNENDPQNPA